EAEILSLDTRVRLSETRDRELEIKARHLGIAFSRKGISQFLDLARHRVERLQTALLQVESSEALDRISALEKSRRVAQEEMKAAEERLQSFEAAQAAAEDASRTMRRFNGEIIRERLTSISPLFLELYSRLRPHKDYLKIRYLVRGDVQHLLSLLVESDIN